MYSLNPNLKKEKEIVPQLDIKATTFIVPKKDEAESAQPATALKQDTVLQQASATGGFGNKQTS
jgi:hypothetical protein